jgi:hypothetical protein
MHENQADLDFSARLGRSGVVHSRVKSLASPLRREAWNLTTQDRRGKPKGVTMSLEDSEHGSGTPGVAQFATTHWSVVLAAGDSTSPDARHALETLCQTYRYPLRSAGRPRG